MTAIRLNLPTSAEGIVPQTSIDVWIGTALADSSVPSPRTSSQRYFDEVG